MQWFWSKKVLNKDVKEVVISGNGWVMLSQLNKEVDMLLNKIKGVGYEQSRK